MNILKAIVNDFKRRVIHNKKGTWAMIAAAGIGAAGAVGGSMISAGAQDKATEEQRKSWEEQMALMKTPPTFFQTPEYGEAEGARGTWWVKLQEWGQQPGYGAIAPNWQDIWGQAQKKVSDYWRGTATTPGVMDRIKASVAQRGVAESPAYATLATRAGAEEAGQLKDIATTQATQEAQFGETGRQNWMQQLMALSQQKPEGTWWSPGAGMAGVQSQYPITPDTGWGGAVSDIGSGVSGLVMNYYNNKQTQLQQQDQQNFLLKLLNQGGYGQTTPTSIGGGGYGGGWSSDYNQVYGKPDMSWAQ